MPMIAMVHVNPRIGAAAVIALRIVIWRVMFVGLGGLSIMAQRAVIALAAFVIRGIAWLFRMLAGGFVRRFSWVFVQ
jgi:hypothetical protein